MFPVLRTAIRSKPVFILLRRSSTSVPLEAFREVFNELKEYRQQCDLYHRQWHSLEKSFRSEVRESTDVISNLRNQVASKEALLQRMKGSISTRGVIEIIASIYRSSLPRPLPKNARSNQDVLNMIVAGKFDQKNPISWEKAKEQVVNGLGFPIEPSMVDDYVSGIYRELSKHMPSQRDDDTVVICWGEHAEGEVVAIMSLVAFAKGTTLSVEYHDKEGKVVYRVQ